jgi:hypothetical protein
MDLICGSSRTRRARINAVPCISSCESSSLAGNAAGLLERHRRARRLRRRGEDRQCRRLRARAPAGVRHDGPGARLRAHPETDAVIPDANGRPRAALEWREWARSDEQTLSHAHRRETDDRAEMDGQTRASRMVDTACVHEQHVGTQLEPLDGRGEHMALPPCEEAGNIAGGDTFGRHRLGEDIIGSPRLRVARRASQMTVGTSTTLLRLRVSAPRDRCCPRPVPRMARARLTLGERHEASPDDRSIGRRPRIGRDRKLSLTRHRPLMLDELLVSRRPASDAAAHGAMMAREVLLAPDDSPRAKPRLGCRRPADLGARSEELPGRSPRCGRTTLNRDAAIVPAAAWPPPRRQLMCGIRAVTLILLAAAVALVVIGVVFFASSHPLRGGVLVVLAVASGVGALLSARYR